jgi:hypothetical protein
MKYLTLAFITTFFAQGALAETVNYSCTMTKQDSHGWIAKEYAFQIDEAAKTAKAASSFQDWAEARFKNRGSKGYRLSWNLTERMAAGGDMRVRYQANLKTSDNTVTVRMAFVHADFANKPFGSGVCTIK